jgi:hypothetical protein
MWLSGERITLEQVVEDRVFSNRVDYADVLYGIRIS